MANDSNRVDLTYGFETTYGETPGAPARQELRFTTESLKGEKETENSDEIDDSRQLPDNVQTGFSTGGAINFEYSHDSYDDFLLMVLQAAAWTNGTQVADGETCTITTGGLVTKDVGTWDLPASASSWIYMTGWDDAGNNGFKKIDTIESASSFQLHHTEGLVAASGDTGVTIIQLQHAANGTTQKSIFIERQFKNKSPDVYDLFSGYVEQNLSLAVPNRAKITGSIGFIGRNAVRGASSIGGALTAVNTNSVQSGSNNVEFFQLDYENACLFSGSWEFINNLRKVECATNDNLLKEIGEGRFLANGEMDIYFEGEGKFSDFYNHNDFNIAVGLRGEPFNSILIIEVIAAKINDNATNAEGVDQEVGEKIQWQAKKSPSELLTVRFAKLTFDAGGPINIDTPS